MALLVFPRVATLSLTMAILPEFGFWIILGIVAMICASCGAYYSIDPRKAFIVAVSSVCAPCMLLHDHTNFFYVVNYTGSVLLTILSCLLPVLVHFENDIEMFLNYNKVCCFVFQEVFLIFFQIYRGKN